MSSTPAKLTTQIKLKPHVQIKPNLLVTSESQMIQDTYKKMEHRQHILDKPGMYIGSPDLNEEDMFVYDEATQLMVKRKVKFVPALYKLFDEALVNCRDHYVRQTDIIAEQTEIIAGTKPANPKIDVNRKYRPVKNIEITINLTEGSICLRNDGDGVDVAFHDKEQMYVPELIFGNLLTGTNYDPTQQRTVGGLNGLGAKLINLYSTEFLIETIDSHRGLKYTQKFANNMIREEPVITKHKGVPYTQITFKPDFARFNMTSLRDNETLTLMRKRCRDIAGITPKEVNVWLDGVKLEVKCFERYVDLYIGSKGEHKRQYTQVNPDWELVVCASHDDQFEHVSFINGICTYKGGKHVEHASNLLATRLAKYAIEHKKGMSALTAKHVKDNLQIFLNCTMVNPLFDSQTKENFTTAVGNFRSKCDLSEEFIEKLAESKMGILDKALKLSTFKAEKSLSKNDGKKGKRIKNLKAVPAYYAGTKKSQSCTLILTEGDSAQSFAISGLAVLSEEQRRTYGVMPLKGKIINPKDCKVSTIEDNQQFGEIKEMLGLKQGADYSKSITNLNYGRIMIMTDADVDGSHIKGLAFNLFHEFWPSLLQYPNFFCSLLTPIIKVSKHKMTKAFYSLPEYEDWRHQHESELKQWTTKYYKGLGTHDAAESRECFQNLKIQTYSWTDLSRLQQKMQVKSSSPSDPPSVPPHEPAVEAIECDSVSVTPSETSETPNQAGEIIGQTRYMELYDNYYKNPNKHFCDLAMNLAFAKKFANHRKGWISQYLQAHAQKQVDLNLHKLPVLSYYDFITEELVKFSAYDNQRSIPSVVDGLKPGQRKIIYACLKRKLRKEIKVAQLAGYVSENCAYHHGEDSLNLTIVGLAQDYTGSNNLNLLLPNGQFGTRFQNGEDAASRRYIFTALNYPLTEQLFNVLDNRVLIYLDDDGQLVEPQYYVPLTCLVLINGANGIGTGWSTNIPSFNEQEVNRNIRRYITGQPLEEMTPYFRGYRGTITKLASQKYLVRGVYRKLTASSVEITEIPVGTNQAKSFKDYKNFIESLVIDDSETDEKKKKAQILSDCEILISDTNLKCLLHFPTEMALSTLMTDLDQFEKTLKLSLTLTTSNMHLFNAEGVMTKYDTAEDILRAYCHVRLEYYDRRKTYLVETSESDLLRINERYRFLSYVIDPNHPLKVNGHPKSQLLDQLKEYHFARFPKKSPQLTSEASDEVESETMVETSSDEVDSDFDYLLSMPIWSLTREKMEKLAKERDELMSTLNNLKATSLQTLWSDDLSQLEVTLSKTQQSWETKYQDLLKLPKGVPRLPAHLRPKIQLTKPKTSLPNLTRPKIPIMLKPIKI